MATLGLLQTLILCFIITTVYLAQVDAVQVTSQMTSTGVTGSNATLVCSWVPDSNDILFTLKIKSVSGRNYYTYFIGRDIQPQPEDNPQRDRLSVDLTTQDSTRVTMRITGLVCDDEQIYQCQVEYNYLTGATTSNQVEMKNASLTIRVPPVPPVMESTPPFNLTGGVAEYSVVTFTCSGNIGKPWPGSVIWKLFRGSVDEQLLPSDHRVTTTDVSLQPGEATCSQRKRSVLTMNVSRSDQDLVVACFIRNNDFSPSGSPTTCEDNTNDLCVQTETIRIHYGVRSASANRDPQSDLYEGSQVTLRCSAEGFPAPTYTWFKVGEEDNILSSSTNGQFTITNLNDRQHGGEYICKASNTVFGVTYLKSDRVDIVVLRTTTPEPTTTPEQTDGDDDDMVSQQPIVSVDEIEDGGTFSVTCDVSRVSNLASSVDNIFTLAIRRQTSQDASFVLLAQYRTYGSSPHNVNIPTDRQWTVDFTGSNDGTNNRNTMKIVILVSDAVCDDAGPYMCEIQYQEVNGNALFFVSRIQNLISKCEPGDKNNDDYNTGVIIGGTITGCIVIIIVVVVVIYAVRRQEVSTNDPPNPARTEPVYEDTGYESISGTIDRSSGQLNERVLNTRMSDVMHGTVQYINQL